MTVTRPSTNRARRGITLLKRRTTLPLRQPANVLGYFDTRYWLKLRIKYTHIVPRGP